MTIQRTSLWLEEKPDVRRYPQLEGTTTVDTVVVGGGIAGVSAAYFLAQAGQRVALLEANHLGAGETGFTTAFLTSSTDTPLAILRERCGDDHARLVRRLGEEGIDLVERTANAEDLPCDYSRLDALVLGLRDAAREPLAQEAEALHMAGGQPTLLRAEEIRSLAGVAASGALRIPRQGIFNVRSYLLGLADRVQARNGLIFEETRMTGLELGATITVKTPSGTVTAARAVLATGLFPSPYKAWNDLFHPQVTYVVALGLADQNHPWRLPNALFWDIAEPFHYMRFVGRHFCLGGEDRALRDAARAGDRPWDDLRTFARTFMPDTSWETTHQWRGQILETADALPLAGVPPGGDPRVLLLSGFGGNGMTLGTKGAQIVTELVTGALSPTENPFRFERKNLQES